MTTDTFTDAKGRRFIAGYEVPEPVWQRVSRAHPLCDPLWECACRSEMGNQLVRDLYEAVHGEQPPAMPISPAELWARLLGEVRK